MSRKSEIILINPLPMPSRMLGATLWMPYGLLYLSESMGRHGYTPRIVYTANDAAVARVAELVTPRTLCLGISTMSGTQLCNALDIAAALRPRYPHLPLVWGGVHATALPEQTLRSELVDLLVWGEGEEVFPAVLQALEAGDPGSLAGRPGVGVKIDGHVVVGPNSGHTVLEGRVFSLPYHLLNMRRHSRRLLIGAEREFESWTSRGCPFRCHFCSNSSRVWPNTAVRRHSIEHVVRDVAVLHREYGADCITFGDESFLLNEERFIGMLEAIRREGISVKYRFSARIDLLLRLKPETWELMKDYGVIAIGAAPESGSQRILDYMNKGITLEQVYQVDTLLTKHRFFKSYNILIGTPAETIDDLKATLRLLCDLAETSRYCPYPLGTLHKYIPLPGTVMFDDAVHKGFRPPERLEDWGGFDFEDVRKTRSVVRPWLKDRDYGFVEQATERVEALNAAFTGANADQAKITELIASLRTLAQ